MHGSLKEMSQVDSGEGSFGSVAFTGKGIWRYCAQFLLSSNRKMLLCWKVCRTDALEMLLCGLSSRKRVDGWEFFLWCVGGREVTLSR